MRLWQIIDSNLYKNNNKFGSKLLDIGIVLGFIIKPYADTIRIQYVYIAILSFL